MFENIYKNSMAKAKLIELENNKKKILFYGAGLFAEEMFNNLDITKLNVVGVCDKKFSTEKSETFYGLKTYAIEELSNLDYDVLFLSVSSPQYFKKILKSQKIFKSAVIRSFEEYTFAEKIRYIFGKKTDDTCIICSAKKMVSFEAKVACFLNYLMFDNKHSETELLYCKKCKISYFKLRPTDEEASRYYENYVTEEFVNLREKFEPAIREVYAQYTLTEKDRVGFIKKSISGIKTDDFKNVLDYGGKGGFLKPLFERAEKYSYDKSLFPAAEGVTLIPNFNEFDEEFDFIMANQVLEHVPYPNECFVEMTKKLKKGGYIYIEVPNEEGLNNDIAPLNHNNRDFVMHEHMNIFRKETLKHMLEANGYKVIKYGYEDISKSDYKGNIMAVGRKK